MKKHYNTIWWVMIAVSFFLLLGMVTGRLSLGQYGNQIGLYFSGLLQGLAWVFFTLNVMQNRNNHKREKR